MNWQETLEAKITELELIASWASITGFPRVRDLCRQAQANIREHIEDHKPPSNAATTPAE